MIYSILLEIDFSLNLLLDSSEFDVIASDSYIEYITQNHIEHEHELEL